jgi:hypothetical protein
MSDIDAREASSLRGELTRAAQSADLAERTFEVVAVVEAVAAPLGIHPVVVGGMAVFAELGFVPATDRRHWVLEGTEVLLEAPSAYLDVDAVVAEIELQSGRTAKVLSRVDVLMDRLAEFQATGHETAAQQALALLAGLSNAEESDLDARASNHRVGTILKVMRELADDLEAGASPPDSGELHAIARDTLHAEYHPKRP